MLSKVFSAATVLLAAPALSSAASIKMSPETAMLSKRIDDCSNYHPMTLGTLVLNNNAYISAYMQWSFGGSSWASFPGSEVLLDSSATYTKDGGLFNIQRDRQFSLRLCNELDTCSDLSGFFNIPSDPSAPTWVATVSADGLIETDVTCDVTGSA